MAKILGSFIMLTSFAAFTAIGTQAQDLGSSSGVFRTPSSSPKTAKPKSSSTSVRKSSAPKTSAKTAPKTSARTKTGANTRSSTSTTRRTTPDDNNSATKVQPVAVDPLPRNDVVITVGNTNKSVNTDELFEQAVEEGNVARDDRDYIKAEAAYRRAQTIKVRDSRAVYGLGNIFADQQRWEEAETSYRQAIALEPNDAGSHIALSYVLTQPIGVSNLADRYEEAETAARRAIQLDPKNAFAHDQLGVALELRGIISEETQAAYKRAIAIEPEFALAYAHLGRLQRRNGKTTESAEAYRMAIKLSTDVPTMILVADVMQSQQRFTESEQLLRRALTLDARNPTALFMLGRALTTRNEFEEAETVLKKSVEVSPNSYVSYTLLSSLYLRRARLDEAEKTLMKALRVVSPSEKKRLAQEFETVGDAFMRIGRSADAQRLYRQAISLDGSKTVLTEKISRSR